MWPFSNKGDLPSNGAKLSALVRGITDAVQSASDIAGQQHFDLFRNYFDLEDGKLVPRVVRMELADGSVMDVPVLLLVNPSSYQLKKLEIEMNVRLKPAEVKRAIEHGTAGAEALRESYRVEMGHKNAKDGCNLKLVFEAEDELPEALSQLMERLSNGYIMPTKADEAKDRPTWMPPGMGSDSGKCTRRHTQRAIEPDEPETDEHDPSDWQPVDGGDDIFPRGE